MEQSIITSSQKKVLDILRKQTALSNRFYFTGGTALAEFYLHHRLSEDLDFFSEEEFSLSPINSFVHKLSAALNLTKITHRNQFGLHTFFLHAPNEELKIDFNYYPFSALEIRKKYDGLAVDSLRDIAVNKLQTIATQPRSRDFIDLFCIVKKTGWAIEDLRKEARNKFDWYVDAVQLGSRFLMVKDVKDYPRMIIPFDMSQCEAFWIKEAKKLENEILKE